MKKLFIVILALALLSGCKKESSNPSISLNKETITLNYGAEQALIATVTDAPQVNLIWSSNNVKVATVSNSGIVKAVRVGTAIISVKTSDSKYTDNCSITVAPTNFLYKEPIVEWGATISTIKSGETRTLYNQTSTGLLYIGENSSVRCVMYLFDSYQKLNGSAVLIANTSDAFIYANVFLTERYEPIGISGGIIFYSGNAVEIGIGTDSSLGQNIIYMPASSSKSSKLDLLKKVKSLIYVRDPLP